jgi:formylglycine-generating enzyme required for sulfatase activity
MDATHRAMPPQYKWYRNAAGITMIQLDAVYFEMPGYMCRLGPYDLSATEVPLSAFRQFIDHTSYRTAAERAGKSWGLNFTYDWQEIAGANWKNVTLPAGTEYTAGTLPVVHVTWIDAAHFCNWLSTLEGLEPYYEIKETTVTVPKSTTGYRLPSRPEWMCAALADTRTSFWWGRYTYLKEPDWRKDPDWNALVANLPDRLIRKRMMIDDAIAAKDGYIFAAPVGTFRPNPLGFFDAIGNVAEWCDWLDPEAHPPDRKPRVGGSWGDLLRYCTVTAERDENMHTSHVNLGFRVARTRP